MPKLSQFRCGTCGRRLPEGEYVYSRFTKARYCLPGKCRTDKEGRGNQTEGRDH